MYQLAFIIRFVHFIQQKQAGRHISSNTDEMNIIRY